jgi:hypothetical protein
MGTASRRPAKVATVPSFELNIKNILITTLYPFFLKSFYMFTKDGRINTI